MNVATLKMANLNPLDIEINGAKMMVHDGNG
jgi:hypothetical protein